MTQSIWLRLKVIVGLMCTLIGIHLINVMFSGQLNQLGVYPRDPTSLLHIITSPFVHGSLEHLMNNLLALSVLSGLILIRSVGFFLASSAFVIVLGGLLVWLFARDGYHIGASGWIFGLWSINVAMAWFDRQVINVVLALITLFFYGGMIYGVLPTESRISFEAHFFGALSGVLFVFIYTKFTKRRALHLSNNK